MRAGTPIDGDEDGDGDGATDGDGDGATAARSSVVEIALTDDEGGPVRLPIKP